jgi:hypothetical protein
MSSRLKINQVDNIPVLSLSSNILLINLTAFNLEKPTFDITHLKDITVKSGQNYEIHAPYRAYPLPRAEWTVDDKEINIDGQRIQSNVLV